MKPDKMTGDTTGLKCADCIHDNTGINRRIRGNGGDVCLHPDSNNPGFWDDAQKYLCKEVKQKEA